MKPTTLTGGSGLQLPEFCQPPDNPLDLLAAWLDIADKREVREPRAAVLSTVDKQGRPSGRVIDLKTVDAAGLVFGTSGASRKGVEVADGAPVALTLYWPETIQQIRVEGCVKALSNEHSDEFWKRRPLDAQVVSTVSQQSESLENEVELEIAVREVLEHVRLSASPVPRPSSWHSYRVVPTAVEFFHGQPNRLHRRLRYELVDNQWSSKRLQP